MTSTRSRRAFRGAIVVALAAGVLAVLRPWTVVPIQSDTKEAFDPERYVESIWSARVLPEADRATVEWPMVTQGMVGAFRTDGRQVRAIFVKGTARVAEVDRKSRVGLARLQSLQATDKSAAIQIGPVLRGTALRDALDFIQFTDFVNQLEFAAVANALNARVLSHVIGPLDLDGLAGREITFVGAVALGATSTLEIVPVRLHVSGGTK
jgi:predicted lipoprotein